jgi:IclR family pca regulon transcriptional regulator
MHLRDIADPFLQELAETFHDSASMAVLEKKQIVYVAHAASKREPRFRVRIGWRLPANATSLGHILLAALSPTDQASFLKQGPFTRYTARTTVDPGELETILQTVREEGYACVQDQLEYGSIAIAVPVHDAKGEVFAAINCSSETSRVDAAELVRSRLPKLRQAAWEITGAVARYPALVHSINSAG